jgi:hypothetical protein
MSVFLGDSVISRGDQPDVILEGHEGYHLASITAGLARDCRQGVVSDPNDEEESHALVFGKKSGSVKNRFAREAVWIVPPPDWAVHR